MVAVDRPIQDMAIPSVTFDNVGVDYGTALFAIGESPLDPNVLWAGSNDGLVHVTRDGGENWVNVTANIDDLPLWGTVSNIEASRFDVGTAYITLDLHQVDDRAPYVYRTRDFGASWTRTTWCTGPTAGRRAWET